MEGKMSQKVLKCVKSDIYFKTTKVIFFCQIVFKLETIYFEGHADCNQNHSIEIFYFEYQISKCLFCVKCESWTFAGFEKTGFVIQTFFKLIAILKNTHHSIHNTK